MFGALMGHLAKSRTLLERDHALIAKQKEARERALSHVKDVEKLAKKVRGSDCCILSF